MHCTLPFKSSTKKNNRAAGVRCVLPLPSTEKDRERRPYTQRRWSHRYPQGELWFELSRTGPLYGEFERTHRLASTTIGPA